VNFKQAHNSRGFSRVGVGSVKGIVGEIFKITKFKLDDLNLVRQCLGIEVICTALTDEKNTTQ
jgi:hypothetical protein